MLREGQTKVIHRADYQQPAFWIDTVELCFDLDPAKTRVLNKMSLRRNAAVPPQPAPFAARAASASPERPARSPLTSPRPRPASAPAPPSRRYGVV